MAVKLTQGIFFSYYWYIDEKEKDITSIRAYGLDENNKNICLRIDDFTPYIYLELPVKTSNGSTIDWKAKVQSLGERLDEILHENKPIKKKLQYKHKLYGAEIDKDGNKKVFPYLLCSFSNKTDYKNLFYILKKPIYILGLGQIKLKMHEQDASEILQLVSCRDIPTAGWIKFRGREIFGDEKLTLCDKEYIIGYQQLSKFDKNILACPKIMGFDIEVNSTNPSAMPQASKPGDKIFQISCVFSREGEGEDNYDNYLLTLGEVDPELLGDNVNAYMFESEADLLEGFTELVREQNPNIIVGYNILKFDIQYMIDRAKSSATHFCFNEFAKLGFHKENISNQEKIKWSSSAFKNQEFDYLDAEGRVFVDLLPLIQRDYKFNNYQLKTVSKELLKDTKDDLSPKGIFKCYRIGIQKETDGTYSKKAIKAMSLCGRYCLKDSILVVKLMEKLKAWVGLAEMAKTTNISIFDVFTQGQQKKVYSQIYKYCMYQNIVVEKDAYITKENERYVGAHVFPPVPGNYERVLPFDFASLYPSTIIAYNIDYSSWVNDSSIPDEKCNVFKWRDCIGCTHDPKVIKYNEITKYIDGEKDIITKLRAERDNKSNKLVKQKYIDEINKKVEALKPFISERSNIKKTISKNPMCEERYYRFLKEPKGVVPTILQNLLDARKNTRKQIKNTKCKYPDCGKIAEYGIEKETHCLNHKEEKAIKILSDNQIKDIDDLTKVLDKRQLAYKISANSMYGILGVKKGLLPFMPGAMCCTFMGRTNIEIVADTITKKYGGKLVYGDTDSNYITFPHLKKSEESWDYAIKVSKEVSVLFPPPIYLEFEQAIYAQFFILTKKRYMYRACERDGVVDKKIGKKGVLLARRDNALLIRLIYENLISMIFDKIPRDDVLYYILEELNRICSNSVPHKEYVITKSVGDVNNMNISESYKDEKGKFKVKVGNYIVPLLPKNAKEKEKEMLKKEAVDEIDYYRKCLPAVVQLAEKMRSRGQRVDVGTRLEYVIVDVGKNKKQYEKIDNIDYFLQHNDVLRIDFLDYVKLMINPIDDLLNVAFQKNIQDGYRFKKDFLLEQYKFRSITRKKVLDELKSLFSPTLVFTK